MVDMIATLATSDNGSHRTHWDISGSLRCTPLSCFRNGKPDEAAQSMSPEVSRAFREFLRSAYQPQGIVSFFRNGRSDSGHKPKGESDPIGGVP